MIRKLRKEWCKEMVFVKNGKQEPEIAMAGRMPQLNWTKSRSQYTTTVAGVFHLLGPDKEEAEKQFRWLLNKHDLGEPVDTNPRFADVAYAWLEQVKKNHDPDRYRLCKGRLTEF